MADTESTEVRESKPDTEPTTEDVVPSVEEEVGGDDTVAIQDGSDVSKDVEGGSETQPASPSKTPEVTESEAGKSDGEEVEKVGSAEPNGQEVVVSGPSEAVDGEDTDRGRRVPRVLGRARRRDPH